MKIEAPMAHTKIGLPVSPPVSIEPPPPVVGEERGGRIWDGEKWVSPKEWEESQERSA